MTVIQYYPKIMLGIARIVWCMVTGILCSYAQDNPAVIHLNSGGANPNINDKYEFYVVEAEDNRPNKNKNIGNIFVNGKNEVLSFESNPAEQLYAFWSQHAPFGKANLLPVYIQLEKLQIIEKRVASDKISGTALIKVSYSWYRDRERIPLTSFETSTTYTRAETNYLHPQIITEQLQKVLSSLNNWMVQNKGKTSSLARQIKLTFTEPDYGGQTDTVFHNPSRPLVWDDFRGNTSQRPSQYAAAVFSSFSYEGNSQLIGDTVHVNISTKVFMVKNDSWALPIAKNNSSLHHEQLHFDLTRIITERFKQRLRNAELTVTYYDSEIQYQFLEAFREMNDLQKKYDADSAHGTNAAGQAEWDGKISDALNQLYSSKSKPAF